MAIINFVGGQFQGIDDNGDPLANGKVYFYEAGTRTPKDTYTDVALTSPNASPVVLDTGGRGTVFLSGLYKVVLEDVNGVQIYEEDNLDAQSGLLGALGALANLENDTAITTNTFTYIGLDGEVYDTSGIHDLVTNNSRLTVPTGVSRIRLTAQVHCQGGGPGSRVLRIPKGRASYAGDVKDQDLSKASSYLQCTTPMLEVTEG